MKDALKDSALDTPAVQTTKTLKTALCVILVSLAFYSHKRLEPHTAASLGALPHTGVTFSRRSQGRIAQQRAQGQQESAHR